MKPPKRQPNSQAHAAGGKDRALANALLRMSEKTEKQEQSKSNDVIHNYGEEESLHGWGNSKTNPRYMEGILVLLHFPKFCLPV